MQRVSRDFSLRLVMSQSSFKCVRTFSRTNAYFECSAAKKNVTLSKSFISSHASQKTSSETLIWIIARVINGELGMPDYCS